ncbi:hypothetical protein CJ030_MR0G006769 [Morella rubra]|uniref:Uncharacterized protein n=1 Tax=Morella rubra TaxID=262757 RepID=A0A6A1UK36_9ROSI|nr:hypothetical protein CJ030_MR0G006769 [Morella rubra]
MPWVLGLVMVFYVAGIVSTLLMLGRSLLCYVTQSSWCLRLADLVYAAIILLNYRLKIPLLAWREVKH